MQNPPKASSDCDISETLKENRSGINLSSYHSRLIYEGHKTLIINSKLNKSIIGKLQYLLGERLAYGIIKLGNPEKITIQEFSDDFDKHHVTDDERQNWWPNKEILFCYPFEVIEIFETPKRIKLENEFDVFIDDFDFVEPGTFKHSLNLSAYTPEVEETMDLADDWKILTCWYSQFRNGKTLKRDISEIVKLGKHLYKELMSRDCDFDPKRMTPAAKEFFTLLSKDKKGLSLINLSESEHISQFKDITVMECFATISEKGSSIQFQMDNPPDFFKKAVELQACNDFAKWDELNFVWKRSIAPNSFTMPLYDLKLVRQNLEKPDLVDDSVTFSQKMALMQPKQTFDKIEDAIKYMFDTGSKYAIEKKYDGYPGIIVKAGNSVKIYTNHGIDISKFFPIVLKEAKTMSNKDFTLNGDITHHTSGYLEIEKYVSGQLKIPEQKIIFNCFDILRLGDNITEKEWFQRKQILHSLNFTPNIKEVSSIIAESIDKARKTITFLKNLKGSNGAVIKRYDGPKSVYSPGEESDAWIIVSHGDTTTSTPGIPTVQGKYIKKKKPCQQEGENDAN